MTVCDMVSVSWAVNLLQKREGFLNKCLTANYAWYFFGLSENILLVQALAQAMLMVNVGKTSEQVVANHAVPSKKI